MFIDYNQNARDRTVASAYSVRPTPDARVSTPLRWDEVPRTSNRPTCGWIPSRRGCATVGDPSAEIDAHAGSLDALLELAQPRRGAAGPRRRAVAAALRKQAGEPKRVQPSRARKPPS